MHVKIQISNAAIFILAHIYMHRNFDLINVLLMPLEVKKQNKKQKGMK